MPELRTFVKAKGAVFVTETIIYHIVIIVFIVVMFVFMLSMNHANRELKEALIPFFLTDCFVLPRQRSPFLRGVRALEYFLSEKFGVKVSLEYDRSRNSFSSNEFRLFGEMLFCEKQNSELMKIVSSQKVKKIVFKQITHNGEWEIQTA